MRWLIDIDNVIAATNECVLNYIQLVSNEPQEKPVYWEWYSPALNRRGWEIYDFIFREDDKYQWLITPKIDAVETLQWLMDRNQEVWLVTSRHPSRKDYTREWLKLHGVPYHRLIFNARKHEVAGDVMIDDSPANVYHWIRPDRLALYFSHSHNRQVEINYPTVTRVHSWSEIRKFAEQLGGSND